MPFKVPSGWVWTIINEVGNIVTGSTPQKDIKEYYGGSIPFYKPNDLEQGINTLTAADHLSILGFEQSRKLPINSVLVTCIGATIGKTGRILKEGTCNQQINAVIHNQSINPLYLYYILVSEYFQHLIRSNASATTLPILNKSNFSKLRIPLPPLSEQQRIVEEIERWFKLIDIIEQGKADLQTTIKQAKNKILELAIHGKLVPQDPNDEPASELLKRVNPKAEITCDNEHSRKLPYNWCLCNLGDVCMLENGFAFSSDQYKAKGTPLIRISNIKDNEISLSSCVFINEGYEEKYIVHSGDLLIAMSGATTGKMGIYNQKYVAYLNQRVGNIKIVDSNLLFDKYRNYFLFSQKNKILELAYGGAQPNISGKVINSLFVPLPPIAEQKRIVKKIEELFLVIDTVEQALQA